MSSFHDNIDERLDDMLEIYGAKISAKIDKATTTRKISQKEGKNAKKPQF